MRAVLMILELFLILFLHQATTTHKLFQHHRTLFLILFLHLTTIRLYAEGLCTYAFASVRVFFIGDPLLAMLFAKRSGGEERGEPELRGSRIHITATSPPQKRLLEDTHNALGLLNAIKWETTQHQ
jgi:hypothetical protein